jgi:hypothetical protein
MTTTTYEVTALDLTTSTYVSHIFDTDKAAKNEIYRLLHADHYTQISIKTV